MYLTCHFGPGQRWGSDDGGGQYYTILYTIQSEWGYDSYENDLLRTIIKKWYIPGAI